MEDTPESPMETSDDVPIKEEGSVSEDAAVLDENDDDSKSGGSVTMNNDDGEDEDQESKSVGTAADEELDDDEDGSKSESKSGSDAASSPTTGVSASEEPSSPKKKRGKPQIPASARKGRAPAVKGLNIPFRTVKKAMKLDPDIPIVQNEAAIMTTLAAELFLQRLAAQSHKICKHRGKNTIRYEDVADARSNDPALAFLKTIIP